MFHLFETTIVIDEWLLSSKIDFSLFPWFSSHFFPFFLLFSLLSSLNSSAVFLHHHHITIMLVTLYRSQERQLQRRLASTIATFYDSWQWKVGIPVSTYWLLNLPIWVYPNIYQLSTIQWMINHINHVPKQKQ